MDHAGPLARAVKARREELMLSQARLAAKSGISESTIRAIEAGRRTTLRVSNKLALTQALEWTPDSIDRVVRGEDPRPAGGIFVEPDAEPKPVTDPAIVQQITELRARITALEEKVERQDRDLLAARAGRADVAAHEPQAG